MAERIIYFRPHRARTTRYRAVAVEVTERLKRLHQVKVRGEGEEMREFELGVGVREWMVKTLSPFHAITRGQENDVQVSEIHA